MLSIFIKISITLILLGLLVYIQNTYFNERSNKKITPITYGSGNNIIILLHGIPTSQNLYINLGKLLSEDSQNKIIIPSLQGTILEDISLVSKITDEYSNQNITLVVHDRGALVGFGLLEEHSERITDLIILDSLIEPIKSPYPQNIFGNMLVHILYSNLFGGWPIINQTLSQGGWENNDSREKQVGQIKQPNLFQLREFFTDFEQVNKQILENQKYLSNYTGSVNIIWGEKDLFLPREHHLQNIKNYVPQANITTLESAKHYIPITHFDAVYEIIK